MGLLPLTGCSSHHWDEDVVIETRVEYDFNVITLRKKSKQSCIHDDCSATKTEWYIDDYAFVGGENIEDVIADTELLFEFLKDEYEEDDD